LVAVHEMARRDVRRIVVLNADNQLVGIVSSSTLSEPSIADKTLRLAISLGPASRRSVTVAARRASSQRGVVSCGLWRGYRSHRGSWPRCGGAFDRKCCECSRQILQRRCLRPGRRRIGIGSRGRRRSESSGCPSRSNSTIRQPVAPISPQAATLVRERAAGWASGSGERRVSSTRRFGMATAKFRVS
jgi:hypothetical protein